MITIEWGDNERQILETLECKCLNVKKKEEEKKERKKTNLPSLFSMKESSFIYRLYQPISSIVIPIAGTEERDTERKRDGWTKERKKERKKEKREETGRRTVLGDGDVDKK